MRYYLNYWLLFFVTLCVFACSKNEDLEFYENQEKIEEVIARAKSVKEKVDSLFNSISSVSDIVEYLDEIKVIEGIENVYFDGSLLSVKIKDGGLIFWGETFVDNNSADEDFYNSILTKMQNLKDNFPTSRNINNVGKDKTACIINAASKEKYSGGNLAQNLINETKKMFEDFGFSKINIINAEKATADFYLETMPTYDVILLHTHGFLYEENNKHYIATGITPDKIDVLKMMFTDWFFEKYAYLVLETPDQKYEYIGISEDLIAEKSKKYRDNSIMFASSCRTLKDHDGFWEILKAKNVGTFLGFDENIDYMVSLGASHSYLSNLLYYQSNVKEAYDIMHISNKEWTNEENGVKANLKICSTNDKYSLYEGTDFSNLMMVDLGLSVKWASRNLGVQSVTDLGDTYNNFHLSTICHKKDPEFEYAEKCPIWDGQFSLSGHKDDEKCVYCLISEDITKTRHDVVYSQSKSWRMPTVKDYEELINNCDMESIIHEGVHGIKFTSKKNRNYIFIPLKTHDYIEVPELGAKVYCSHGSYLTGTFVKEMNNSNTGEYYLLDNSLMAVSFMTNATIPSPPINPAIETNFDNWSYIYNSKAGAEWDITYLYYIRPVSDN